MDKSKEMFAEMLGIVRKDPPFRDGSGAVAVPVDAAEPEAEPEAEPAVSDLEVQQAVVAEMASEKVVLEEENAALKRDKAELEAANAALGKSCAALETAHGDAQAEWALCAAALADLGARSGGAFAENEALRRELERAQGELADLRELLKPLKAENRDLEAKLERMGRRLANARRFAREHGLVLV